MARGHASAFTMYAAAFLGEIWRGAIEAIPRQQWEAAAALPLSPAAQLRHVILPQAFRIAIPPTVGFLVQLIKGTSIASIIGFVELTRAGQLIVNVTFQPMIVYPIVGRALLRAVLAAVACVAASRTEDGCRSWHCAASVSASATHVGARRRLARRRGGRSRRGHRPLGLGQDHAAPLHQRPGEGRRRHDHVRRQAAAAATAPRCAKLRRHIGIVFQSLNLFPHHSVERNITLGPDRHQQGAAGRGEGGRARSVCARSISRTSCTPSRRSSPAASSSASRSPARWRCSRG